VNPDQVRAFVRTTLDGTPTGSTTRTAPATPVDPQPAAVTLDVVNTTRTAGAARAVLDQLAARGTPAARPPTPPPGRTRRCTTPPGQQTSAEQLTALLGTDIPATSDRAVPAGHLQLYLGADYTTLTSQQPTEQLRQNSAPPTDPSSPATAPITADGVPCIN
jgi:hypothetical protein